MKIARLVVFIALFAGLQAGAQDVKVIKFPELQQMLDAEQGLVVYNFWATWCRPCVAELPGFAEVAAEMDAKIQLISLDFSEKVHAQVEPFLKRKQWNLPCVLLDEVDYDSWMGKIDADWDGAIPATLVVNRAKGVYEFFAGEMSKAELMAVVEKYR